MTDKEYHIFYSWQSDLNRLDQQKKIRSCIISAAQVIEQELNVTLYIDEATRDTSGAIDIADSIVRKIRQCDIFIADVSIINPESTQRKTPNPNIMFELGVAIESVGWNNIIFLQNKKTGTFEDMPFDIRSRRAITFTLNDRKAKIDITGDLINATRACLENEPKLRLKEIATVLKRSTWFAYNFINGRIDKSDIKGIVTIDQVHHHIFSFQFESFEFREKKPLQNWKARFFINESTLTTAELAFESTNDFGFKTLIFPLNRNYTTINLIGDGKSYGNQVLERALQAGDSDRDNLLLFNPEG